MAQKNSPGDRPTHPMGDFTDQSLLTALSAVNAPGYYKYKHRPMAPTQMRRVWLTRLHLQKYILLAVALMVPA
jgi:hypothetical protein